MLTKIVTHIAKYGMAAARKKFGAEEVKQAAEIIKSTGLKRGKPKKPSKPKGPSTSPRTAKPKRPSEKATKTPRKPKTKPKGVGDFLESMFGRKRTGPTPKRSDSQAYRDGVKAGKKAADEKLDPSLKNKDMIPRSLGNRTIDVARQLREAKELGKSSKEIGRLEARFKNLKEMAKDRPDLTTTRGRGFSQGGLTAKHTDLRKTGLFK